MLSLMKLRGKRSLAHSKLVLSLQVLPPHIVESRAIVSISCGSWRVALLRRGYSKP